MKNSLAIAVIAFMAVFASTKANDYRDSIAKQYVVFQEFNIPGNGVNVADKMTEYEINSCLSRSQTGWIYLYFADNVPDSIQVALNRAKQLWEQKMPEAKTIYVMAEMSPLPDDIALETAVSYCGIPKQGCPGALSTQLTGNIMGTIESPDAIITLNSNIDWNCDAVGLYNNGTNVQTMGLRGFARCFGFGTTLRSTSGSSTSIDYYTEFPCYFDVFIYDHYNRPIIFLDKSAFPYYLTTNRVTIKGKSAKYSLYSPNPFVNGISLTYLSEPTSLMHYNIGRGDRYIYIDYATTDILNAMGWSFSSSANAGEIVNTNLTNGIISAFFESAFSIKDADQHGISSYDWTLSLRTNDGTYESATKSNAKDFAFKGVINPEDYYIDSNGMLDAMLICDYQVGVDQFTTKELYFKIDLSPVIISLHSFEYTTEEEYLYSIRFVVESKGANRIRVKVEQEYDPSDLRIKEYSQGDRTDVEINHIDQLGRCWIEVTAYNAYSTAIERKALPAFYNSSSQMVYINPLNNICQTGSAVVRTLGGMTVYQGPELDVYDKVLKTGIYVLTIWNSKGVSHNKICIQ